ncbi:MAG TPA: pyridoxamine 5'-phosphate oxidase family protein [Dehalococcoidia bacterium]|nr:pyridoxamine 5'-phosphate oxidase family protein [Dehalococcoidia bacterium]
MARWADIEREAPEFAARVRARFGAHKHKILATVRKDGSPRLSGIEATFADGEVWFGSMSASRKSADLARDPRLALHAMSDDPPEDPAAWPGDAKLAGRAVRVDEPARLEAMGGGAGGGVLYRIDIDEVVLTRVPDPPDHLQIDVWRQGRGLSRLRAK